MDQSTGLLQGFAALLWPVFAFTVLFLYRTHIAALLSRVKRGKIFGQEFDFDRKLEQLQEAAIASELEVAKLPPSKSAPRHTELSEEELHDVNGDRARMILTEAVHSPVAALMHLANELEKAARDALAVRGRLQGRTSVPLRQALDELQKYGLPANLVDSLQLFFDIRNKFIHSPNVGIETAEVLRAIDSGLTILKALDALPAEDARVLHPGVDVFYDAECTQRIPNVKGLVLEIWSPSRVTKRINIFPTTRLNYRVGKRVAWEWNLSSVWNAAWYRDPSSAENKPAWIQSGEFIGRQLDDI